MSNHNLFATPFRTKEDLEQQLRQNPGLYRQYQAFSLQLQKRLDDYLTGKATLPFTYDPFFKKFFSPDVHPDRLSRLLSAILGMKMKAARILPKTVYIWRTVFLATLPRMCYAFPILNSAVPSRGRRIQKRNRLCAIIVFSYEIIFKRHPPHLAICAHIPGILFYLMFLYQPR